MIKTLDLTQPSEKPNTDRNRSKDLENDKKDSLEMESELVRFDTDQLLGLPTSNYKCESKQSSL